MLLWILIFMFVMAPAFAVWENRAAEARGQRLVEEVRAELASGGPVREFKERKLIAWPYILAAIVISSLWALASIGDEADIDRGSLIGAGIVAAVIVWIVFHIFIFVKRMRTGASLLLLVIMIASAAMLAASTATVPAIAEFARGLS